MSTPHLSNEEEAYQYLHLLEAVIDLAMVDYSELRRMSAITLEGKVNEWFWGRRANGGMRHPKNIQCPAEARYLLAFLNGGGLDYLCSHLPISSKYAFPCRIRKSLRLKQRSAL